MKSSSISVYSWQFLELVIITLIAYSFFQYHPLSEKGVVKFSNMLLVLILLGYSLSQIVKTRDSVSVRLKLLLVSIIISMFCSWIFWGQNILLSYRSSYFLLYYVLFFYLSKRKPSEILIEKYIIFIGVVYSLLWLYGISCWPNQVFGTQAEDSFEDLSRGFMRVYFIGITNLVLAFFLCVVKYTKTTNVRYLFGIIYFFTIIVFQLTRQVIFFSFLIGAIYYFYYHRKKMVYVAIFCLCLSVYLIPLVMEGDNVISSMVEFSEKQQESHESGKTDIRIIEYEFFFTSFSKNIITSIFGNGLPHTEGPYGKALDRTGYFPSDVGYAQIYMVLGVVGLIIFMSLLYKVIKSKVSSEYAYAKLFVIYAIFGNIASGILLELSGIFCLCISLYVIVLNKKLLT